MKNKFIILLIFFLFLGIKNNAQEINNNSLVRISQNGKFGLLSLALLSYIGISVHSPIITKSSSSLIFSLFSIEFINNLLRSIKIDKAKRRSIFGIIHLFAALYRHFEKTDYGCQAKGMCGFRESGDCDSCKKYFDACKKSRHCHVIMAFYYFFTSMINTDKIDGNFIKTFLNKI